MSFIIQNEDGSVAIASVPHDVVHRLYNKVLLKPCGCKLVWSPHNYALQIDNTFTECNAHTKERELRDEELFAYHSEINHKRIQRQLDKTKAR